MTIYKKFLFLVGPHKAFCLCRDLGVSIYSITTTTEKLDQIEKLIIILKKEKEKDNFLLKDNIQRLIKLNTFRGIRHKFGYPVRGQRTRSNAKTSKKLKFKV